MPADPPRPDAVTASPDLSTNAVANAMDAIQEAVAAAPTAQAHRPERIGPYHILEFIDGGGMGEVYKAERRSPMRQLVAIKIIKLGFDTREVIARFESERQALARMDHPHVARVLDAGTTESGRPYFVMEYVAGVPITKFADDNKLTIKDRLLLFTQVCEAIAHAHTKAIIHRDIKASNVLAHLHDGKPTAKVIDFGIAKALTGDRLTERTFNTDRGHVVGTWETMSPEQAEGSPDIDTRTDVYSLGVLLYELLSGMKPLDSGTLAKAPEQEIRRMICEFEPPRPSTRLSSLGEHATKIAALRRARLDALARQLRSELEWIPLKAMRKERDRRYASTHQIVQDIQNYLRGRPLLAGPESRAYRLRKFGRRNRLGVVASAAVLLSLVVGAIATGFMYSRSERQRRRAEARFNDVRDLAGSIFELQYDVAKLPGSTTVVNKLAQTGVKYLDRLHQQAKNEEPLLREVARGYRMLGEVQGNPYFSNIGDYRGALASYRNSATIIRQLLESHPHDVRLQEELAYVYLCVAAVLKASGDLNGARESYERSLQTARTLVEQNPSVDKYRPRLIDALNGVGDVMSEIGENQGALKYYQEALDMAETLAAGDSKDHRRKSPVWYCRMRVGEAMTASGRRGEGMLHYREALAIAEKCVEIEGTTNWRSSLALNRATIANALAATGDLTGAETNYRKSLAEFEGLAKADPANALAQQRMLDTRFGYGNFLSARGDDSTLDVQPRREYWIRAREVHEANLGLLERMHERGIQEVRGSVTRDELKQAISNCTIAIVELERAGASLRATPASTGVTTHPTTGPIP